MTSRVCSPVRRISWRRAGRCVAADSVQDLRTLLSWIPRRQFSGNFRLGDTLMSSVMQELQHRRPSNQTDMMLLCMRVVARADVPVHDLTVYLMMQARSARTDGTRRQGSAAARRLFMVRRVERNLMSYERTGANFVPQIGREYKRLDHCQQRAPAQTACLGFASLSSGVTVRARGYDR